MRQYLTDDKSTLGQVMAWCHQATSHYLSQCWSRSLSPYGVTRSQSETIRILKWISLNFVIRGLSIIVMIFIILWSPHPPNHEDNVGFRQKYLSILKQPIYNRDRNGNTINNQRKITRIYLYDYTSHLLLKSLHKQTRIIISVIEPDVIKFA